MELREKLKILLDHWIEHNDEHIKEYSEWINKLKREGFTFVAKQIEAGALYLLKANDCFSKAKEMYEKYEKEGD